MATEQDAIKVYLPREDGEWIRAKAVEEDRSVAYLIRRLVREYRELEAGAEEAA